MQVYDGRVCGRHATRSHLPDGLVELPEESLRLVLRRCARDDSDDDFARVSRHDSLELVDGRDGQQGGRRGRLGDDAARAVTAAAHSFFTIEKEMEKIKKVDWIRARTSEETNPEYPNKRRIIRGLLPWPLVS